MSGPGKNVGVTGNRERGTGNMEEIDKAAIMYNKTKDIKYRELWYKLIKEYVERYL